MTTGKEEQPPIEVLPRFQPGVHTHNDDMCTVLYGYGIDAPTQVKYVDDYTFVGGICRNVPRNVAKAWAKGVRWQDEKPAISRIYPQAILPNDATEVDFAKATGVTLMPPAQLAAMISATDAQALVAAMGRQQAVSFAEQILENVTKK